MTQKVQLFKTQKVVSNANPKKLMTISGSYSIRVTITFPTYEAAAAFSPDSICQLICFQDRAQPIVFVKQNKNVKIFKLEGELEYLQRLLRTAILLSSETAKVHLVLQGPSGSARIPLQTCSFGPAWISGKGSTSTNEPFGFHKSYRVSAVSDKCKSLFYYNNTTTKY